MTAFSSQSPGFGPFYSETPPPTLPQGSPQSLGFLTCCVGNGIQLK